MVTEHGVPHTYHSTNVTRVSDAEQTANVMEFNIGANAVFPKIKLDIFNTQMTPRMSLLGLRSLLWEVRVTLGGLETE